MKKVRFIFVAIMFVAQADRHDFETEYSGNGQLLKLQ
jgi:hypothetical protein